MNNHLEITKECKKIKSRNAINIILYPYLLLKTGWNNCRIMFLDSALD